MNGSDSGNTEQSKFQASYGSILGGDRPRRRRRDRYRLVTARIVQQNCQEETTNSEYPL